MQTDELLLIGYASGVAANNPDCGLGPWYLYYHEALFKSLPFSLAWQMIEAIGTHAPGHGLSVTDKVAEINLKLAKQVQAAVEQAQRFCVIGGDHSSAIGTWSGVAHALRSQGDIGLIWIDAHMDSHTPETSLTENIHGMPAAHLLGHGIARLCHLLDHQTKIKPQNICFIGIRSYEAGEAELLQRLGVRIYFMQEVAERGIDAVLEEAILQVKQQTCGYGITLDLDGLDPSDAPGVGYREPPGISAIALLQAFQRLLPQHPVLGLEIAEFNPLRDINQKTALLIPEIIRAVYASSSSYRPGKVA